MRVPIVVLDAQPINIANPDPFFLGLLALVAVLIAGGLVVAVFYVFGSFSERWAGRHPEAFGTSAGIDESEALALDGTLGEEERQPVVLALHAVEVGDTTAAIQSLRSDLDNQTTVAGAARIRLALAYLLSNDGMYEDAVQETQTALHAYPRALALCAELAGLHVRAHRDQAAEALLAPALAYPVGPRENPGARFLLHHLYGQALRRMKRLPEAEQQLRSAVTLAPDDAIARNNFGAVLDALGRAEEAEAQYREGIRLAPETSSLRANLGALLLRQGRLEEAQRELSIAAELAPERFTAHSNLAALNLKLGKWQEAEKQAGAALAVRPDFATGHLNLAQALLRLGHLRDAETHACRAIELTPDDASAHALLGYVYDAQGMHDRALDAYRQGLRLNPDLAEQVRAEAISLDVLGLTDSAEAERQHAEQLDRARAQLR